MAEDRIPLKSQDEVQLIFGPFDRYAKLLREIFQVNLVTRDGLLKLVGSKSQVRDVKMAIEKVLSKYRRDGDIEGREIEKLLMQGVGRRESDLQDASEADGNGDDEILRATAHAPRLEVAPKTAGQEKYVKAIRESDICFAIGPAGTGKTYLAVAMAVEALRKGRFRKLILARPAVEAGEKLGFLPGGLEEKINPYLRPLYDALNDLLEPGKAKKYIENDVIEIVPLAYMRGRTLNHSFIILDEGQNTTSKQMQMFLTRMGEGSKIVVTGDITQTDLPVSTLSGLLDASKRLGKIKGISFIQLAKTDIVRHSLVQKIVEAYEKE